MGKSSHQSPGTSVPASGDPHAIEARIGLLAEQFARDVLAVIGGSRLDELMAMARDGGRVHGTNGSVSTLSRRVAEVLTIGGETPRRRRWPTCSQPDCVHSYYPASGTSHLCYQHFIASGGRHPNAKR